MEPLIEYWIEKTFNTFWDTYSNFSNLYSGITTSMKYLKESTNCKHQTPDASINFLDAHIKLGHVTSLVQLWQKVTKPFKPLTMNSLNFNKTVWPKHNREFWVIGTIPYHNTINEIVWNFVDCTSIIKVK